MKALSRFYNTDSCEYSQEEMLAHPLFSMKSHLQGKKKTHSKKMVLKSPWSIFHFTVDRARHKDIF